MNTFNLQEAYYQIYEQQQLDEISVETIKSASKEAGKLAGQAATLGGDPEYVKKKRAQQERLYTAQAKKRLSPKVKTVKITREEVEAWVNALVEEGYDLSEYTWDDMCEMYMDEARRDPDYDKMRRQEDRHTTRAVRQPGGSRGSSKNRASKMRSIRGALERGEDPRADGYGGARAARGNPPEDHRAAFSKNPLNNPPRRVKEPGVKKESFDLFDTILEYLVAEGYADTNENALAIMANMSEEWRNSIIG